MRTRTNRRETILRRGWSGVGLVLLALVASAAMAHDDGHDGPTVLVGAGEGTTVVDSYLPERIVVREGATVTWRQNGDEPHTVTFTDEGGEHEHPAFLVDAPADAPGQLMANPRVVMPTRAPDTPVETYDGTQYVNSGLMSLQPMQPDAPPNDSFSLTFTEPGRYEYHCAIHPHMHGVVEVVPMDADVPSPEEIAERAEHEAAHLLERVEAAREQGQRLRREPGPDGSTFWYVRAGGVDAKTGDLHAQSFDFMPEHLTVHAGDTVIWTSPEFHTVTFAPEGAQPELLTPHPQQEGPPLMVLNPEAVRPVKPAPVHDPGRYFNSGLIGIFAEGGLGWALTFEEPGTYEYVCIVHRELGMEGTITVEAR